MTYSSNPMDLSSLRNHIEMVPTGITQHHQSVSGKKSVTGESVSPRGSQQQLHSISIANMLNSSLQLQSNRPRKPTFSLEDENDAESSAFLLNSGFSNKYQGRVDAGLVLTRSHSPSSSQSYPFNGLIGPQISFNRSASLPSTTSVSSQLLPGNNTSFQMYSPLTNNVMQANRAHNLRLLQQQQQQQSTAGHRKTPPSSLNFGHSLFSQAGREANNANLDSAEFPQLGGRHGNNFSSMSGFGSSRNYIGMLSKVQEPQAEFNIHTEEFPALPGTQNPPKTPVSALSMQSDKPRVSQPVSANSTTPNGEAPSILTEGDILERTPSKSEGIVISDNNMVYNIPNSMMKDAFGMVGFLSFLRKGATVPGVEYLAPGLDLNSLGFNLTQTDRQLYSTFASPWSDVPCRPQDIDFHVPQEYQTNIFIKTKLPRVRLDMYDEDTLFLLFYMFTGDVLQLLASRELYNRDWRYHKEKRVWITRPDHGARMRTASYEEGIYLVFQPETFTRASVDMKLEYDKLERAPGSSQDSQHKMRIPQPFSPPLQPSALMTQQQQSHLSQLQLSLQQQHSPRSA